METVTTIDALQKAERLIAWLRDMTMQGQVTVTDYALERKPSDHEAIEAVRQVITQRPLNASREFFIEVDSLLSWVSSRGWCITSDEDKETCTRLYRQAREVYEVVQR